MIEFCLRVVVDVRALALFGCFGAATAILAGRLGGGGFEDFNTLQEVLEESDRPNEDFEFEFFLLLLFLSLRLWLLFIGAFPVFGVFIILILVLMDNLCFLGFRLSVVWRNKLFQCRESIVDLGPSSLLNDRVVQAPLGFTCTPR